MSAELAKVVPIVADKVGPKRSPKLRPIRPSAQDVAYHCGYSVTLAEQYRQGTTWSKGGTADHDEMAAAFKTMTPPKKKSLSYIYHAIVGTWPDAKWEVNVKIQVFDPESGERLVPEGTGEIDLLGTLPSGRLIVIDFKFGAREVPLPDDNAQILTYGYAIATERDAPAFMPVIYQPLAGGMEKGRWHEDGDDYWRILGRMRVAASNDPNEPIVGTHCDGCYVRTPYCRAFAQSSVDGETALAKYDTQELVSWSDEKVAKTMMEVKALEERIEQFKENVKDEAARRGGIRVGGKIWGPTLVRGRRSIAVSRVEGEQPELFAQLEAAGCVTGGGWSERFAWKNIKKDAGEDGHGGSHE